MKKRKGYLAPALVVTFLMLYYGGMAAVFSGSDEVGYAYCLATRDGDLRQLGKEMTGALNGRGGGKPNFQQGSVKATKSEIEAFFAGK